MMILFGLSLYFVFRYVEREKRTEQVKRERDFVERELQEARAEIDRLQEQLIRSAETEDVWRFPAEVRSPFRPRDQRQCRVISFLNLKGGPGKTTLSANLAACFATMASPLRVLLVDLDFQGTLSNLCVRPDTLQYQGDNKHTAAELLRNRLTLDELNRLIVPMQEVPGASVIIAKDDLAHADFRTQAQFLLNPDQEVRFRFTELFHQAEIDQRYHLVIFDCPPRLTTSTVNALACSDWVLVPSNLDEKSFEAVPRTLKFLERLGHFAQPKILGVVANAVLFWRKDKLLKAHAEGFARLERAVRSHDPDVYIFQAKIPLHTDIGFHKKQGLVPAADPAIAALFLDLAREMRQRIGK